MQILDDRKMRQKIRRLAIEIMEHNHDEPEIILAGINNRGMAFARLLQGELAARSSQKITLTHLQVNPADPKRLLGIRFIHNLVPPREKHEIVNLERDPLPVDAHPPAAADDPQQHSTFDAGVDDALARTKLKPVGENDHRVGAFKLLDRNVHVATV